MLPQSNNFTQSLNIHSLLALSVLNEERFNDVNEDHPENIAYIYFTLLVLNEDKLSFVKEEHPQNICFICTSTC